MQRNTGRDFKRKVSGSERMTAGLPLNVVMVARILGNVERQKLSAALDRIRQRHALLAVRLRLDEADQAWFETEGVPEFPLEVVARQTETQWMALAEAEFKKPFDLAEGPLARFSLVHSARVSELIVCAQHAICDGISLAYLIRDILQQLGNPGGDVEILPDPPAVDAGTVPAPRVPVTRPLAGKIMRLMNKEWEKKNIRFSPEDFRQLQQVFWASNREVKLLAWIWDEKRTAALVAKCKAEQVTVNSALWAAFLAAQREVQSPLKRYHQRAGLAVSTRDKLLIPVGEAFGFYASSLTVQLKYTPGRSFWENARTIHAKIKTELRRTDLFRALKVESLSPGLLDSLYHTKYGLLKNKISQTFLKMMKYDRLSYGYAITNVGRMDVPTVYGDLTLDAVYGPSIYSDVDEKVVGVITVGGKLSFCMTCSLTTQKAELVKGCAMEYLARALDN